MGAVEQCSKESWDIIFSQWTCSKQSHTINRNTVFNFAPFPLKELQHSLHESFEQLELEWDLHQWQNEIYVLFATVGEKNNTENE